MGIELRAGDDAESIALVEHADTIGSAKRRARYLKSAVYARAAEMSRPFQFVGVYDDGELMIEY